MKKLLAIVLILGLAGSASAATISVGSTTDLWPTAPLLETFDPTADPTSSGMSIYQDRIIGQSFVVSSTVDVTGFYTETDFYDPATATYVVTLYEVDDTTIGSNGDPGFGTVLAQGTVSGGGNSAETITRYDFSEPITLSPQTSPAGYAVAFRIEDDGQGDNWNTFLGGASATPWTDSFPLIGGSVFHWGQGSDLSAMAFALIPEPVTLALLGVGGLAALLGRRRNRR